MSGGRDGVPSRVGSGGSSRATAALVLALIALAPGGVRAQETPPPADSSARAGTAHRARLLVTGIAGSTIYLSFETERRALAPGQVLELSDSDAGRALGRVTVIESGSRRVLARFAGDAFPVTRGTVLFLVSDDLPSLGELAHRPSSGVASGGRQAPPRARADRVAGPRLSGVFSLESDLRRSRSIFSGQRDGTIERTFATPGARLRATLSGLPGGVRIFTSLRGYRRERDSRRPLDESRVHVFEAYATASPAGLPVTVQGGRFLNRYEAFTGYWDGGLVRVADGTVGLGAAVGWEPAVREERLERDLFKYGGFLTVTTRAGATRYAGSLSAVRLDPGDSGAQRTVLGASQRLTAGRVRLHANVEVEPDSASDRWIVSRLNAGAGVRAGRLRLRASASRLRRPVGLPFDPTLDARRAGPRVGASRDRLGGGLSLEVGAGALGGDVTWSRDRSDRESLTFATHVLLPRTLPGGLGLRLNGFLWQNELEDRALSASAALSRRWGGVRAEAGYRFDRSERTGVSVVSHGIQLGLSVRTSSGWTYRMDGFARRGVDLETERLYGRLSRSF